MVVIAVDLEPKLYGQVRNAVVSGSYESIQQFLEVAAWNQLALEETTQPAPRVGRARKGGSEPGLSFAHEALSLMRHRGVADGMWRDTVSRVDPSRLGHLVEPRVADDPSDVLWGQTNRLLPMSTGVRVLAHMVAEGDGPVARRDWYETATTTARRIRVRLQEWDKQAGRKRGELWATAFPEDDESSGHRYMSQFLGVPARDGSGRGGAAFLGFVAFDGPDDLSPVRMTTSGAKWASFLNPIFDTENPTKTFSVEETSFFLEHLRRYRPGEYQLLAAVASLVAEGHSRTEIDAQLKELYPPWSKYIGTMRAGAIGRLSDLGLLGRTRRGLQVDYHLTELASELKLAAATDEQVQ